MESLKVRRGDIFMAFTALVYNSKFESLFISAGDSVGGMAVIANREWFISVGDRIRMNAPSELLVNPLVTFGTGLAYVLGIDA